MIQNRTLFQKNFWGALKPMLSNKFLSSEKLILVENQKILMTDIEIIQSDPVSDKVIVPPMKAILKYRKHPSILTIKGKCKRNLLFLFSHIA